MEFRREQSMSILEELSALLQQGRAPKVKQLVAKALEEGIAPKDILAVSYTHLTLPTTPYV